MAIRKGNAIAVYNASGITLLDGDETDLFVDINGGLLVGGTISTTPTASSTSNVTSVADTITSTTLLAANAGRLGATVANDSSADLFLLLDSGAASTTNYTVRLVQYAYYEVPFGYQGVITGVWASDPGDGAARVTELEA